MPSTASESASVVIASRNGPSTAARGAEAMIVTGVPDTLVWMIR